MLLVQSKGAANSGTSGTIAFTSNVTAGNLLLVMYVGFNLTLNAPTDNLSNTWFNIAPLFSGTGLARLQAWAAIANSSAACTVSYSNAPSANEAGLFLEEWSGVEQISFAAAAPYSGTSTTLLNDVTPLTNQLGTAVLIGFNVSNTSTLAVTPGTVRQGFSLSAGGYCTLADTPVSIQTSIASFSTAWSTGSSASGVLGALFLFPVIPSTAANSSFAS